MPAARTLTGIIPPLCTPFTEDGDLDVSSLERLIGYLLDNGVHGLFMLGSTSETATLSDRERETIIDVAVRTAAGAVPVLAGVIDMGTARQIAHAQTAQRLGVDGLVATAPFYISPSPAEVATHYRTLRQAVDLPILAYDIPQCVHVKLERETIATLAHEGVIDGLKDSSGAEANFRGVLLDTRDVEGFVAFTGSELTVDSALLMGAAGCVPGLGNVDPAGFVRLFDAMQRGDYAAARAEQEHIYRLFAIVRQATPGRTGHSAAAFGSFKTALVLRGVIATNVPGRPMTRLNAEETDRIRSVLVEAGLL